MPIVKRSKNKQTAKRIQPNNRQVSLHHKSATFQGAQETLANDLLKLNPESAN
jgi:hypothetical protein